MAKALSLLDDKPSIVCVGRPVYNALMTKASDQSSQAYGTLWVVATPLGHRDDISDRAREVLTTAPVVAAEDTRITRRLVEPARHQRWVSVNEHSESDRINELIDALRAGDDVALVSDAGTPLISDPGFRLVSAAHDHQIRVSPVPGPSAAIAALSVSGLPCDRFFFEGFLPPKRQARQRRLTALADHPSTWIVYVPARDLGVVLEDMSTALGAERPITLARELTKQFETVRRSTIGELKAWVLADPDQRLGEAVCVIHGSNVPRPKIAANVLARALKEALPPSKAARLLANVSGLTRQQAWALVEGNDSCEDGGSRA